MSSTFGSDLNVVKLITTTHFRMRGQTDFEHQTLQLIRSASLKSDSTSILAGYPSVPRLPHPSSTLVSPYILNRSICLVGCFRNVAKLFAHAGPRLPLETLARLQRSLEPNAKRAHEIVNELTRELGVFQQEITEERERDRRETASEELYSAPYRRSTRVPVFD
jgi:hypothetical protein